jgi:hypothetical protein
MYSGFTILEFFSHDHLYLGTPFSFWKPRSGTLNNTWVAGGGVEEKIFNASRS